MKKRFKILSVILAIALTVTCVYAATNTDWMKPAATKSLYQQAIDDHGFIYGINYPWAAGQGCSLSDNEARELKCSFSEESVRSGFYNISKLGIDSTILWLFMQGEGIDYDDEGDVVGVQDLFMKNLETTLKIAKEYGVALSLTIQPHFDYTLESATYSGSKERYDKYTRMLTDPTVREHYLEKCVRPVLKLINKYRDIVFAISPYCEPEGDIYGEPNGYKPFGTSLENMTSFIADLTEVCREELKDIPVWVTSGWSHSDTLQYFNQLDLDFIGRDIYSDSATVPSVESATITTPVVLGEFGPNGNANYNNTLYHLENYKEFIANAKEAGYTGAYYWCYNAKGQMMSLLADGDTSYMPQMANIYYTIKDANNAYKGVESGLDAPTMLYHNFDGSINFIASRDAYEYIIERSTDGKTFKKYDTIAADEADTTGNLICTYKDDDAIVGVNYYYRVTAVDMDGNTAVSDISLAIKGKRTTCDESENLVSDYSFESVTSKSDITITADSKGVWDIVNGTEGNETHTGNVAIKLTGVSGSTWAFVQRTIPVEKDTNYTYTFYAKSETGKLLFKILDTAAWSAIYESTTSVLESDVGVWKRYTCSFNSGDMESVTLIFADNGGTITVDDIYLFKADD